MQQLLLIKQIRWEQVREWGNEYDFLSEINKGREGDKPSFDSLALHLTSSPILSERNSINPVHTVKKY